MPAQAVQLFPMKNSDNVRRDEMFESLNNKSDQIIQQTNMEKTDDIAGAIFQSKSDISGELVPGLIRKNYSGLLNQEYCSCPICGKRLKAWNKKVKRTIESLGGCLDLYRPYFYCKHCHGVFIHQMRPQYQPLLQSSMIFKMLKRGQQLNCHSGLPLRRSGDAPVTR